MAVDEEKRREKERFPSILLPYLLSFCFSFVVAQSLTYFTKARLVASARTVTAAEAAAVTLAAASVKVAAA